MGSTNCYPVFSAFSLCLFSHTKVSQTNQSAFCLYVCFGGIRLAHWSLHDAFLSLCLFLTTPLCLSSVFTVCVSVSHLMTCCRWSYDSWITASGLITAYVNKPVSYANPNHIWLGETITTEEQQEKEQLDTCFSDSPVSQTFMRTSCQPIWNFCLPFLTRLAHVEWERIHALFSLMTVHNLSRLKVTIKISGTSLMFLT